MAFSITALEMVNRVRLFRRQPTTTVIDTPEDEVTLNAINMAIEDVLSTRKWEFDLRTDGQLALRAKFDGANITTTAGSNQVTIVKSGATTFEDADMFGDYVVRVLADGISDYANTAFRIEKSRPLVLGTTFTATLETSISTSNSSVDCELHYGEYILPDTVGSVVRATYQELPLTLDQVDPKIRYSEIFPRPHIKFGPPEIIAVGGFDRRTWEDVPAVDDQTDPGLRMAVWPIPDDEFVINYSYYIRHPALTIATSTLEGVPQSVVNDIVLQATSTVMMTWDQNFAAAHFTDMSREQAATKHKTYGGSPARRHTIHSFERGGIDRSLNNGFPGKVIG